MGKVVYIPTLQEYAKKRKNHNTESFELLNCSNCNFCRKELNICLWGENIRNLKSLTSCPATNRVL